MRTKDEYINQMVDEMPFILNDRIVPYIKELLDLHLTEFIEEAVKRMEEESNHCATESLLEAAIGNNTISAIYGSKADAFNESIELIKSMKP